MKIGKIYNMENKEYLVLNGTDPRMPDRSGRKILMDRKYGVGADYILVFTGSDQEPSFLLYGINGESILPGREAYIIQARYLRDIQTDPKESLRLHDPVDGTEITSCEVRITDYFWGRILPLEDDIAEREIA